MKKLGILIVLILILLQFSGCNLVTSFESYTFDEDYSSANCNDKKEPYYFHPSIRSELVNKIVIPGVIDRDIYKGPYTYNFTIDGDYEKLVSVESKFVVNGKREIPVPVSIENMNAQRTVHWTGIIYFTDGEHKLPLEWEEVESLVMKTKFVAEKNGVREEHSIENIYKKKHEQFFGNRFVMYIAYF
jgi:hypothetical protein